MTGQVAQVLQNTKNINENNQNSTNNTRNQANSSDTANESVAREDVLRNSASDNASEHLQNDLYNIQKLKEEKKDKIKPHSSQKEDISKAYEISVKKTLTLQGGKAIYRIHAPDDLVICNYQGNEYNTDRNGNVNATIAFGYKMTLFVKDKKTNKLLFDDNNRPQTITITNTQNAKNEATFVLGANTKQKIALSQMQPKYSDEVTDNKSVQNNGSLTNATNTSQNMIFRSQEPNVEKYDTTIRRQNAYRDIYGRTYHLFEGTLPQGLRLASIQNGQLMIHGDNKFTLYSGQNKTLYVVNNYGQRVKDNNENYISLQVSNAQNAPREFGFNINNDSVTAKTTNNTAENNNTSTKEEEAKQEKKKQDNKVVLGDGLVTLETKQEQKVVQEWRSSSYYYGYYQRVNVKRTVNYSEATINLPNDSSIYISGVEKSDKKLSADGTYTSYTLRLDKPLTFGVIKDNKIEKVYTVNPQDKTLNDVTSRQEGLTLSNSYYQRPLPLTNTNETVLSAGSHITLQRDANNNITNITINSVNGFSKEITVTNDSIKDEDGLVISNLKLQANGTLSYNTKMNVDGKTITTSHNVSKDGTHTEKDYSATIFNARAQVLEYGEFRSTNADEAQKGADKIVRNRTGIADKTLLADARDTIKKAAEKGALPLFFASFHGARNYNTGTGGDSKWVNIIAKACKEERYEGPVGIQMQHCYSGVSQLETQALAQLPAGSYIIKSQDNRLSYYTPGKQSADGDTLAQAKHPSALHCAVYFVTNVISQSNNPTYAVKTKDGNVQVFSDNDYYPGSTSSKVLPQADQDETKEILIKSQVPENTVNNQLGNRKARKIINFLRHAANQSDYAGFNAN